MEPSQINDDSPAASLPISHDSPTFQLDTLKDNSKVKSSTFPVNEEAADAVQIDIDSTDPSDIQDNAVGDRRSTGVSEIDNNPAEITARRSLSRVSSSSNGKYYNGYNIPVFKLTYPIMRQNYKLYFRHLFCLNFQGTVVTK